MRQPAVLLVLLGGLFSLRPQDGTGPAIEARLAELKANPVVPPLAEVPDDYSAVPQNWLALVSWNVQGGATDSPGSRRPAMVGAALGRMFGGTYQLLAAQEVANNAHATTLRDLLPGGAARWRYSFFDTTDGQDNGLWYQRGILVRNAVPLFVTGQVSSTGRLITDPARAVHPPLAAHVAAGDFDFTLITLHLTFAGGDTEESARELRVLLDFLDEYFRAPGHDPDVILCGDFNIPSRLSGQTGRNGITLDPIFDGDPRFQSGERRFVVTVHEPTSRNASGSPVSNYDHCVFSADVMEELIQARRLATQVLTDHPDDPEVTLTSDHFPIVAFFAIIDPPGNVLVFYLLTEHLAYRQRLQVALVAVVAAGALLTLFALGGREALAFLGISAESFRVAAGLLLLVPAYRLVAAGQPLDHVEREAASPIELALVPLAMPLIAGPGALATTIAFTEVRGAPATILAFTVVLA
ncbi:MAG: hypothetical protein K6T59_11125, partial [Bryobacteraceae bacterium]|nr:hypothetical protein [Bryobacteraceae bacterium]